MLATICGRSCGKGRRKKKMEVLTLYIVEDMKEVGNHRMGV